MTREIWLVMGLALGPGLVSGCGSEEKPAGDGGSGSSTGAAADTTTSSGGATTAVDGSSGGDSTSAGSTGGVPQCEDPSDARPTPRGEVEGMWDADRDRFVFFGGDQGVPVMCMSQTDFVAETWAFRRDCGDFVLVDAGGGPSARGRAAIAPDPAGARMIVHGGRWRDGVSGTYTLYDDTWAFDLTTDTWTEIVAPGGPSGRSNHTAVVAGDQLLVFGGNGSNDGLAFIPLGDLWSLDLTTNTWTEIMAAGGPSARLFHAATVTPDGAAMFVYGGGDENAFFGPFFGDLWMYEVAGQNWSSLNAGGAGAPIGSIWGDLLFDADASRLLLWGAHEDNLLGNNNKIWEYDLAGGSWTMLAEGDVQNADSAGFCDFPADFVIPDLDAPERRNAGAAALTHDGELVVFGGKTDCGIIDDLWIWSLADQTWDNPVRATFGDICLRAFAGGCETMCY